MKVFHIFKDFRCLLKNHTIHWRFTSHCFIIYENPSPAAASSLKGDQIFSGPCSCKNFHGTWREGKPGGKEGKGLEEGPGAQATCTQLEW